jgi:hypothetical protein
MAALDETNLVERHFVAAFLSVVLNAPLLKPDLLFHSLKDQVSIYVKSAVRIGELAFWRSFYANCGQHELANNCADLAIALEPQSGIECDLLRHLCAQRRREKDSLMPIEKWIKNHPEQGLGRISYLVLVEKYARNQILTAIKEIDQWLDANPNDAHVRTAFLIFVERNRKRVVGSYVKKYEKWLNSHPEDSYFRSA